MVRLLTMPVAMLSVIVAIMLIGTELVSAVGRNPTAVEHNACRVKWSEQINEVRRVFKDERTRVVAYNKGLDGMPCMTSCRILYRGNAKDMEDIYSPEDVQCATGPYPRFCQKGRCVLPAKYRTGTNDNNGNEETNGELESQNESSGDSSFENEAKQTTSEPEQQQ